MIKQINVLILALITVARCGAAAANIAITADLRPVKSSYLRSEPIELALSVTNTSNSSVRVAVQYPTFGGVGAGIKIWNGQAPSPKSGAAKRPEVGTLSVPLVSLLPGQVESFKIYLQRFVSQTAPGLYELSYSVDVPCWLPDGSRNCAVSASGRFTVAVAGEDDVQLARVLAGYAKELKSDDSTYWQDREAEEALCVTDSPIVLPYLAYLMKLGERDSAILALGKFKGNADAEELAVDTALRGVNAAPKAALSVLEQWGYALDEADLRTILAQGNYDLKLAAFRYARTINSRRYIPTVAAYINDPNPGLAEAASKVGAALEASIKQ